MLKVLVFASLCILVALAENDCPPCDRSKCAKPAQCATGVVWDRCHCCKVCGLAEGEQCNTPTVNSRCGKNMTCQSVPVSGQTYRCVCDSQEELCGSDDVTYRNICHLKEVRETESPQLRVKTMGPCKRKPVLITGPEHSINKTGGYAAMSCEATGTPIPIIDWIFTRGDNLLRHLPEDNGDVSVYLRGGPSRHQITGWIQIINLKKEDEGYYTCMAHNDQGRTEASARLIVTN